MIETKRFLVAIMLLSTSLATAEEKIVNDSMLQSDKPESTEQRASISRPETTEKTTPLLTITNSIDSADAITSSNIEDVNVNVENSDPDPREDTEIKLEPEISADPISQRAADTKDQPRADQAPSKRESPTDESNVPISSKIMTFLSSSKLITLVSLLVALLSTGVAFYLYRWRSWLTRSGPVLMPERVGSNLDNVNHSLKSLEQANQKTTIELLQVIQDLAGKTVALEKNIDEMTDISMTLQGKIASKDDEITRFKEGYDQAIYQRFLAKFIKVNSRLQAIDPKSENISKDINLVKILLEDALEDCGVKEQAVEVGSNFIDLGDIVSDNPDIEATNDPSLEGVVKSVLTSAYVIGEGDTRNVIVPAKVLIYRLEEN